MTTTREPICPFCGPEIAADTFMESRHYRAIYNVAPILPGHSLIVPKRHVTSMLALTDEEACEMTLFGRHVVKVLLRAFKAGAFNWTIQEGNEAGQSVPHMHLHLIPRLPDDLPTPGDWYPLLRESSRGLIDSEERPRLAPSERQAIVRRIRAIAENGE